MYVCVHAINEVLSPKNCKNIQKLRACDSNSGSGESSDSESEKERGCGGEVHLRLSNLQALSVRGLAADHSVFASNGSDAKRIKALLKTDSSCECGCCSHVPFKVIYPVIKAFWTLPKESQDSLLWSLQCAQGRKRSWYIEGLSNRCA